MPNCTSAHFTLSECLAEWLGASRYVWFVNSKSHLLEKISDPGSNQWRSWEENGTMCVQALCMCTAQREDGAAESCPPSCTTTSSFRLLLLIPLVLVRYRVKPLGLKNLNILFKNCFIMLGYKVSNLDIHLVNRFIWRLFLSFFFSSTGWVLYFPSDLFHRHQWLHFGVFRYIK